MEQCHLLLFIQAYSNIIKNLGLSIFRLPLCNDIPDNHKHPDHQLLNILGLNPGEQVITYRLRTLLLILILPLFPFLLFLEPFVLEVVFRNG